MLQQHDSHPLQPQHHVQLGRLPLHHLPSKHSKTYICSECSLGLTLFVFHCFFFFLVDSLNKKSFLWSPWVNFCNKVAVLVLFGRGQRQTLPSQHSASKDRGAVVEEEVRKIDLTCCGTSPLLPPTPPLLFHLVHRSLVRYQSLVRPLPSLLPLPLLQRTHKHTEHINHTAAAALSDSLVTFSGVATVSLHQGS